MPNLVFGAFLQKAGAASSIIVYYTAWIFSTQIDAGRFLPYTEIGFERGWARKTPLQREISV